MPSLKFVYTLSGVLLAFLAVEILGQNVLFLHDASAAFALSCLSQERNSDITSTGCLTCELHLHADPIYSGLLCLCF